LGYKGDSFHGCPFGEFLETFLGRAPRNREGGVRLLSFQNQKGEKGVLGGLEVTIPY